MLLRLPFYIVALFACVVACSKDRRFVEGNAYSFQGSGTYMFDSELCSVMIGPFKMELIQYTRKSWKFIYSGSANISGKNELVFERKDKNKLTGQWAEPTTYYYHVLLDGQIVKENQKKGIVGEMTFTFIHEYIAYDGPFAYPVSTPVPVAGTFSLFPE